LRWGFGSFCVVVAIFVNQLFQAAWAWNVRLWPVPGSLCVNCVVVMHFLF
jgi:hypothetical protein